MREKRAKAVRDVEGTRFFFLLFSGAGKYVDQRHGRCEEYSRVEGVGKTGWRNDRRKHMNVCKEDVAVDMVCAS